MRHFPLALLLLFNLHLSAQTPKRTVPKLDKIDRHKPMNVIFILSDDHRYDFMGFLGTIPWLKTPAFDKMAKEGIYFKNAFVTTSLCSPSRASILTGQYSHVHTIVDNVAPEPDDNIYFPEYLQKAGYQTSFFGKWHMGHDSSRPRPGFDHWEGFRGQGVHYNPALNINGKEVQFGDSAYTTDLLTEHAINWLEKRDKEKPFMLYLSHKAVHGPYMPAKRHKGMYKGMPYELPATYYQTLGDDYKELDWPNWVKEQRYSWHGVDYAYHAHKNLQELVQAYCEMLMGVDESVESVLKYLKKNQLEDNTVVIYMGDNGFSWGEHGLIDKRHFYEESVKVPLLIYAPGLFSRTKVIEEMTQNIDVAPFILELAGLKKPDYMPGRSVLPLIEGRNVKWRDKIFYEYFWEYDFPMTPTVYGVRTDRYKYIRYMGIWDQNELYDLKNDPDEMCNLINKPEFAEIGKELAAALFDWLEDTEGMQIPIKRTIKSPSGDYRHPNQY